MPRRQWQYKVIGVKNIHCRVVTRAFNLKMLHRSKKCLQRFAQTLNYDTLLHRSMICNQPLEFDMLNLDQFAAAQKTQFDAMFGLATTAFEGAEKLLALNVATGKALMGESAEAFTSVMSAKDPGALLALSTAQAQPSVDKAMAYGRQFMDIVTETGTELAKATEGQAALQQQAFGAFVDAALKNAPAGTESMASFVKGAMSAQNNAQAAMQKAVKQASDMAQQSFEAAAAQATTGMKAATAKKR